MNEEDIEILSTSQVLQEVENVVRRFNTKNDAIFTFPTLTKNNKLVVWTAIFQHLQRKEFESIHNICLSAARILSRDKCDLDQLFCEKWINILVEKAGLYNYVDFEDISEQSKDLLKKEIALEALKCLCNSTFNSEVARSLCAHTSVAQALIGRLRVYKDVPYKDEIMLYDMKLLFILTAFRPDIKKKVNCELHGMDYLISCLNELLKEAMLVTDDTSEAENGNLFKGRNHPFLQDNQQAIACEILKVQFNLIMSPEQLGDCDEAMYLKLMPVLSTLLCASTTNETKLMDLRSNVGNLLTSVPSKFYKELTPILGKDEECLYEYDGRTMDALQALVELLNYRLSALSTTERQFDELSPIMSVMLKSVRACHTHRKYLRQVVLPPLRDVSSPPEKGDTLRNMLCRLLTTPVTNVRDLVAEFIFILCKEKVGRMVKYTGFGNAAGHLAQKGLLGGGRGADYSSSSDDSDTEEYRDAQPHIDPVVGCTRPPRPNPLEGMTEEQKEYEAMKLVNLFDKMVSSGVVKPARVGADGRPEPVEHVLQLRDAPTRPQS
ncbi:unnamed protein product [Chilo suppressalis]|uniref:Synembryn n=1 Tax=Chilo suppressalis TaxID=168631 RepID=A0ABN8AVQ9_CHISP|nr:unnamed protein product [Chilo suppressalis]